ncbi:YidH family protein [Gordonia sp. (in: high G+C Gram-positive bacteria)]|uniref:YidH family protein n=1 Tax=Gordonia sp. (in: high G+C Gram-positive bacteria) TaxID=84139 RepID=UPI003F98B8EA
MSEEPKPGGSVDARFTLAAERTMLAWLRTALGLVAAGVAVLHLIGEFTSPVLQTVLGVGLVLLGAVCAAVGGRRWYQVTHALEHGGRMPGPFAIWVLIGGVVVLSLAFVFVR